MMIFIFTNEDAGRGVTLAHKSLESAQIDDQLSVETQP